MGSDEKRKGLFGRLRRIFGEPSSDDAVERERADRPKLELISDGYVDPRRYATKDLDEPILGVDFGTSYCSIALLDGSELTLVPLVGDDPMMPSVVSYAQRNTVLVGEAARERLAGGAQHTISSPKRLLGRLYKDPAAQRVFSGLAFDTFAGSDEFLRFRAHETIYSAQDVCAEIFAELRQRATAHLGTELRQAIIASPVSFGSLQRSALEQAARQAGFRVQGTIAEPTAAVMAQGFPRGWQGRVALYDFGGGTFDFSLLEVHDEHYKVLCSGGEPWLGGDDIDGAIAGDLANAFATETRVDLRTRAVEWQRLLFAAEKAKRELTTAEVTKIAVPALVNTTGGTKGLEAELTRERLEELVHPLAQRSLVVVERVLTEAQSRVRDIDAIVMTGGTSLVPCIQRVVGEFFSKSPMVSRPHLAVVQGAAVEGARVSGRPIATEVLRGREVRDVIGRTIGAAANDGALITLFNRSTPLPSMRVHRFSTMEDGRRELKIVLFEQHTSRVDESKPLGTVVLRGLKGLPAGQEYVDVTFAVDQRGVLAVKASVGSHKVDERFPT